MTKFEQIIIAMLIIILFIINPFSWILYFDQDGYLGPANFVIILLFDFLFILLIVLSFYYKDMKFVLKLLSFNLFGVLVCCLIIDAIFGSWFSRESIRELWIPSNQVYKIDLKNIYPYEKDYIIKLQRISLRPKSTTKQKHLDLVKTLKNTMYSAAKTIQETRPSPALQHTAIQR